MGLYRGGRYSHSDAGGQCLRPMKQPTSRPARRKANLDERLERKKKQLSHHKDNRSSTISSIPSSRSQDARTRPQSSHDETKLRSEILALTELSTGRYEHELKLEQHRGSVSGR